MLRTYCGFDIHFKATFLSEFYLELKVLRLQVNPTDDYYSTDFICVYETVLVYDANASLL